MFRAPECAQVRGICVVEGLNGPLNDRMAGCDHIALVVFAIDGLRKDMEFARIGIDEFSPEFRISLCRCRIESRILFIVVFVDEGCNANDMTLAFVGGGKGIVLYSGVFFQEVVGQSGFLLPGLVKYIVVKLMDVHQLVLRKSRGIIPILVIGVARVFYTVF